MAPRVDPVPSDATLPERSAVVVIGGGIIGTSAALTLAERGIDVTLCEKGIIAGEQSSRNLGWCRKAHRDPRELPLIIESLRMWKRMDERIGDDTGFDECGIVYVAETQRDLDAHAPWLEHAKLHQLDIRYISGDEAARLLPGSTKRWAGALYSPTDGRAEPQKAAPAIARAAQRLGAKIVTSCAVRGIEFQAGRVSGVVTERGTIACDSVLLAGGVWSSLFCANLGVRLPQLKIMCSIARTEPLESGFDHSVSGHGFLVRKRADGGYNITRRGGENCDIVPDSFRFLREYWPMATMHGTQLRYRVGKPFLTEARHRRHWSLTEKTVFEDVRVLDPEPYQRNLDESQRWLKQVFPVFREARIAESWAGMIDVTPDAVPVISEVEGSPGFFIATGFSGHGFGIGPAAGRLAADLVCGSTPLVDPKDFHLSRLRARAEPQKAAAL